LFDFFPMYPLLGEAPLHDFRVGDTGAAALAVHCTKLEALRLPNCPFVTMQGVRALAQHARSLQHLTLPVQFAEEDPSQVFGYDVMVRPCMMSFVP
jgi:hypothetical protein